MNVLEKIEEQQKALKENTAPWVVGEQLKEICADPHCAELVSADLDRKGMGLADCEKKIKAYADKHRSGNSACVPPNIAENIIREFYGLPEQGAPAPATSGGFVSLEDFI